MQKIGINTEGVKKSLPYGGIKEVAKRSKVSIYTVARVLKGRGKNAMVIKELKIYMDELQQKNVEWNDTVNAINDTAIALQTY